MRIIVIGASHAGIAYADLVELLVDAAVRAFEGGADG